MADAEIIQLGSRGRAGRGSRSTPSAAARGLAPDRARPTSPPASAAPRSAPRPAPEPDPEPDVTPPEPPTDEVPPTLSLAALLTEAAALLRQALDGIGSAELQELAADPVRGLATLAHALGVDWPGSIDEVVAFARTRLNGDYAIDDFGFDPEFTTKIFLPLLRPLVQSWFRLEVRGAENLPTEGSALLVSNHAGTLPLDGMILHTVVFDEIGRHVRMLGADLIFKTPYSHDLARKTGTTLACQEDAERLLGSDQLVAVFPEGFKGLGKLYADRYKLQRFGRGGFVSAAVRAQVPIIPVSIVGSEEIYPLISRAPTLARALGVPYFPVTPLFPWLGVLGMIPLPSKWIIEFGEAVTTDELPPGAADDPMVVFNVTDQVRETIQQTLYSLLMQRRSAFF
ncbi:MAG TPA: lysophospholipid acyltransferase family protein [Propionibacteriaceae bacterium]|nr:lysophospholipid acyltransferase family protein [Propionibacteriaceae bacterium]